MHVLEILNQRKNRVTAPSGTPVSADSQAQLNQNDDEDDVVILDEEVRPKKAVGIDKPVDSSKTSSSGLKSAKKTPSSSAQKVGMIHSFFSKKEAVPSSDILDEEERKDIKPKYPESVKGETVALVEINEDSCAPKNESEAEKSKNTGEVSSSVAPIEIVEDSSSAPKNDSEAEKSKNTEAVSSSVAQSSQVIPESATDNSKSISVESSAAATGGISQAPVGASNGAKKELNESDLAVFKEKIRGAGSKSKEALIKETIELLPHCRVRQLTLRLGDLALKYKWAGEKTKVWRLKEDISEEELDAAIAAENERKSFDQEKKAQKKRDVKAEDTSATIATSSTSVDPVSSETKAPEAIVIDNDVVVPEKEEKKAPFVTKPKELDPRAKDVLNHVNKVIGETKDLLREIFHSVECVRPASVVNELAKAVPLESLQNSQPSDEAVKLMTVIVSDSRLVDKPELIKTIVSALEETEGVSADTAIVGSWLDLVAKKVEYLDDCWAFEMERKEEKVGKSRRAGLRSTHQMVKTLTKLDKDIGANRPNANYEKMESSLKDAEEKLAKAKREWFNRDEKMMAMVPPTTATASSTGVAAASAAPVTSKPVKGSSKKKSESAVAVKEAQAPTPKPKNTLLTFFNSSAIKRASAVPPPNNASTSAVKEGASANTSLLEKFNDENPRTATSNTSNDVEFVGCSPSAKRTKMMLSDDLTEVQIIEDAVSSDRKKNAAFSKKGSERRVVLFIDTRLRCKVYRKGKDEMEYFGRRSSVSGRRPFGRSDLLDYEIDSEDEDGESLSDADSQGDEEEEDSVLDYKDGWLERDEDLGVVPAPETDMVHSAKFIPRIVGLVFNGQQAEKPLLSTRNQPFEPQSEDPATFMSKFTCAVRYATIKQCEEVIRPASGSTSAASATSPAQKRSAAESSSGEGGEKKRRRVQEIEETHLKVFVEIVEGGISSKKNLVTELQERLKQQFPDMTVPPSKAQIETKLDEIAEKIGMHWVVKDDVMRSVGLERKLLSGSLSLFEKMTVLQELKKQGKEDPTEQDIIQAEQTYLHNKLVAEQQRAKAAKEAKAALKAAKAAVSATMATTTAAVAIQQASEAPALAAVAPVEVPLSTLTSE